MPLPIILLGYAVDAAVAAAVSYGVKEAISAALNRYGADLEKWAIKAAAEQMGVHVDPDGPINAQTITAALNEGPLSGSGIEFTNIFDRDAILHDFKRLALARASVQLNLSDVQSVSGLRDGVRAMLREEVTKQIASEAGGLIDAAKDLPQILRAIEGKQRTANWNAPRDFTPAGISNRQRQAKYRAGKTKHWEDR